MRLRFFLPLRLLLPLVLSGSLALAQDAGMQATQDAMQASQMAAQVSQQAMQDAQMANQQAMQASQQAMQDAASGLTGSPMTAKPNLSMPSGTYPATFTVRMKDKTRSAVMFYTTDGWTPTALSIRYVGPIQITSTTHLQVIAVAPYSTRSQIARASYILPPSTPATSAGPTKISLQPSKATAASSQNLMLAKGAEVPLVVTANVSSKKLEIGDAVPMVLARDLTVNGIVVAKKGTPAVATVLQTDGAGMAGQPGSITFVVHSLAVPGNTIPLDGIETKEGRDKYNTVRSVAIVPFVGISALFVHGKPAEIAPNIRWNKHLAKQMPEGGWM
jgi:hypothetical protein